MDCQVTWVILVLGFLLMEGDLYVFSEWMHLFGDLFYIIVTVIISELSCNSEYFAWVPWVLVVIQSIGLIGMIYLLTTRSKEEVKKTLE